MGKRMGTGAVRVRSWAILLAILVIVVGGVTTLIGFVSTPDGDYGQLQLPGSTVLHLPQGRMNLTFTEDLDNQTVDEPATLHITITPTGGGSALPVNLDPNGGSVGVNGVTHTYWGYVMVPQAGDYRVDVPDDIAPSIPNPRLLFGPDAEPQFWILGALVIAILLVIVAIVATWTIRRHRPGSATLPVPDGMVISSPMPRQPRQNPASGAGTVRAWFYVTGVNGPPPVSAGLGPVRVSGEIRTAPGTGELAIPVVDHELTAPAANWPQVGVTLPIWLSRGQDGSIDFVVLWESAVAGS
ncbi:MAG TPA: hypothetical protein VFW65_38995 [Pseudonocardiaceae bacterium]|nr:hypothetical protein [Pseudonocardiaceae bacterium]